MHTYIGRCINEMRVIKCVCIKLRGVCSKSNETSLLSSITTENTSEKKKTIKKNCACCWLKYINSSVET